MTDGIHIPREIADAEGVPEDLDASIVGPYRFPDPRRRRLAAGMYLVAALVAVWLAVAERGSWLVVVLCGVLSVLHAVASWPLETDQEAALGAAARVMPFPIGHASAAIAFAGIRSRPRWQVIAYSADDPPSQRALAEFDAGTGEHLGEVYVEEVPDAVGRAADVDGEQPETLATD